MAGTDKYANILTQQVVMSGANTLTFQEVNIGLSLFDKAGILISRIEYEPTTATIAEMTNATDNIQLAITASNSINSLGITQASVIHRKILYRHDMGTAGTGALVDYPFVVDFASLPGGGILITPKPWYVGMTTGGLASAGTANVRFYFQVMKLTAESYFELLETRQYFG